VRSALEKAGAATARGGASEQTLAHIGLSLGRSTEAVIRDRLQFATEMPAEIETAARDALSPHGAMRSLVPLARA
jgi:hypothetical protein